MDVFETEREEQVTKRFLQSLVLALVMAVIGAGGLYLGETDDAPPAGLLGILLMIGSVVVVYRAARREKRAG